MIILTVPYHSLISQYYQQIFRNQQRYQLNALPPSPQITLFFFPHSITTTILISIFNMLFLHTSQLTSICSAYFFIFLILKLHTISNVINLQSSSKNHSLLIIHSLIHSLWSTCLNIFYATINAIWNPNQVIDNRLLFIFKY